jgi:hypothetical protein
VGYFFSGSFMGLKKTGYRNKAFLRKSGSMAQKVGK